MTNKLLSTSTGVVFEEWGVVDDFQVGSGIGWTDTNFIDIVTNAHYLTTGFPGSLQVIDAKCAADNSITHAISDIEGSLASGATVLGNAQSQSNPSIVAIDQSLPLLSGTAQGRRVYLPFGRPYMMVDCLTSDGELIYQRALEWAAGADV